MQIRLMLLSAPSGTSTCQVTLAEVCYRSITISEGAEFASPQTLLQQGPKADKAGCPASLCSGENGCPPCLPYFCGDRFLLITCCILQEAKV